MISRFILVALMLTVFVVAFAAARRPGNPQLAGALGNDDLGLIGALVHGGTSAQSKAFFGKSKG